MGTVSALNTNPLQVILVNSPLHIFPPPLTQLINISSVKNILILQCRNDSSVCLALIKKVL